jgi:hypothetical protein
MKILILMLSAAFALPASAETSLKCPELKQKTRSIKIMRMQPLRRGKVWLEGSPKSVNTLSCDLYGMKTEEAEYDGKNLVLKHSYTYLAKEEAVQFCQNRKSQEKLTTTFSDEAQASVDDFCRRNKKKDFGIVQVFDASPSQGGESSRKPVRLIFRIYNKKGFTAEEHAFDPFMNLETVTLYAYDKKNNLTEMTVNDFDGRQLRREAWAWNKAAASRTHSIYGQTNQLRKKTVFEMRETGTLRREVNFTYDSGEQPITRSETYCDDKGRPEKELIYDADAAGPKYELTYTHKYDAKGNWTEERRSRVIVFNGNRMQDGKSAPEITKREFIYY